MWSRGLRSLALGIISAVLTALPVSAAERIYFNYGPFSFSVSVDALETFAKEGKVEPELGRYLKRLSPEQQTQLRNLLQEPHKFNHVNISRIFSTRTGGRLMRHMGELVKTKAGQNGFYAIRSALVLAAAEPEGLTAIDFLGKFPTDIQIDIQQILRFRRQISTLFKETNVLVAELEQMTAEIAASEPPSDFNRLPDLRKPGKLSASKQIINLLDPVRDRKLIVDLYLPKATHQSHKIPVIVISNGLGAKPDRFKDLAQHLASYGFAVAIPDHPGSNAQRQREFYAGLHGLDKENFDSTEFIDRPLDITYLLNELEQLNQSKFKGQLNLQQVGVFGYSFGGSTALALAGAEINFEQLEKDCSSPTVLINISLSYQCRALELPRKSFRLRDDRIKAAFVFVPFSNSLFGQAGMSHVTMPILWEATAEDVLTPLLLEQVPPFTWLKTSDKYLVVTENLPHTRMILGLTNRLTNRVKPSDLDELLYVAQSYHNALSLAFFKVYLAQDDEYRRYLQASYAQALSKKPYKLNFLRSITASQLCCK